MRSDKYSGQDFTNRTLAGAKDLAPGLEIVGSCFAHQQPDTEIFPEGMAGVTFVDCNLDNVYVPPGNTVIGGSQRRFAPQSDGTDWLVDEQGSPIAPLNPIAPEELG